MTPAQMVSLTRIHEGLGGGSEEAVPASEPVTGPPLPRGTVEDLLAMKALSQR